MKLMARQAITNQEIQAQVLQGGSQIEDLYAFWSAQVGVAQDYVKIECNEPAILTKIPLTNGKASYHVYFPNLNCCAYVKRYQLGCFDFDLLDPVDIWNTLNLN